MRNDNELPTLTVHPGEIASITDFAVRNSLAPDLVLNELRQQLREHFNNFGTKPFILQYSPTDGFIIQATSAIGLIRATHFLIHLAPKFPNLTLGKCLAMSQLTGASLTAFNNRARITSLISQSASYSTIEYLAFSFLDALITVRNNGFARRFQEVWVVSSKMGANIDIQSSISQSQMMPPVVSDLEATLNIFPNQLLKAAYGKALENVSNSALRRSLLQVKDDFNEVGELDTSISLDSMLFQYFTFRRSDYERALRLAVAILNGNSLDEGIGFCELLPAYTIDLDKLFETFVGTMANKMLSTQKFAIQIQTIFDHDTKPKMDGGIVPDLVVLSHSTNKRIVLDLKNKYSSLREAGKFSIANPDLYQIAYYSLTLKVTDSILVFPSNGRMPQFPIKYSESESAYREKVKGFLAAREKYEKKILFSSQNNFNLHLYHIDLAGTMDNTLRSIASLCLFIEYLLEKV